MGDIPLAMKDWDQVEQNPFFCPTRTKSTRWTN
jgi:chorismate synthase